MKSKQSHKKDQFYEELQESINKVGQEGEVILLGDLIARIGNIVIRVPEIAHTYMKRQENENGERVLVLPYWTTQHWLRYRGTTNLTQREE